MFWVSFPIAVCTNSHLLFAIMSPHWHQPYYSLATDLTFHCTNQANPHLQHWVFNCLDHLCFIWQNIKQSHYFMAYDLWQLISHSHMAFPGSTSCFLMQTSNILPSQLWMVASFWKFQCVDFDRKNILDDLDDCKQALTYQKGTSSWGCTDASLILQSLTHKPDEALAKQPKLKPWWDAILMSSAREFSL